MDKFNQNGGMSAPGAGATQEALGVSKTDKTTMVALMKDIFAGEHGDHEEEDEEEEEEVQDEVENLRRTRIRAFRKLYKHFREQEKKRAQDSWDKMEKIVVRIPEAEMRALFEKTE